MGDAERMRAEILGAVSTMEYGRDLRQTPSAGRRAQFQVGWEDAAVRDVSYTDTTLQRLTWRNAGYRLGKVFGNQPEYMSAAYEILAEQYMAAVGERATPEHSLDAQALAKVDQMLDAFARFRSENEEHYLKNERSYKEELFSRLETAWEELHDNPVRSQEILLGIVSGQDAAARQAITNLLGGRGYAARENFAVLLANTETDEYAALMERLFDQSRPVAERLGEFRNEVNAGYKRLHPEGKFRESVTRPPTVPQSFVGVLLMSYDPDLYILYRWTEYERAATWLGLQVPGSPEHAYTVFMNMAHAVLDHAREKQAPVHDLLDVHNMIYVLWKYGEFAPPAASSGGTATKASIVTDPAITRAAPERTGAQEAAPQKLTNESFYDYVRRHGFNFPDWLVTSYVLSLATKPFVILSGISGTGKTKLAQLLADYAATATGNAHAQTYVAVRPDWTDNSHLLGWYNAISELYERTPVLETIIRAADMPQHPHFIILDEMNIAKVEHYFSDFLSAMESRLVDDSGRIRQARLHLHNQDEDEVDDVPPSIALPLNIYVTGTVNIDESTYMFSPKVLDRANVIEFNQVILGPEASGSGDDGTYAPGTFELRPDVSLMEMFAGHRPATLRDLEEMAHTMPEQYRQLLAVHAALQPYHMHFGYRVANEIAAFMLNAKHFCVANDTLLAVAFDLQVMQKVLPKLHGNAAQLQEPLESLDRALPPSCTLSRAKLERMQQRLDQVGFTAFVE